MKKSFITLVALFAIIGCVYAQSNIKVLEKDLRFCEGSVPYRGMVLVSNFGSEQFDPLNKEGKGYIVAVDSEGVKKTFIKADGSLSAPKGMAVSNNKLYIADVAKIVVYDLNKPNQAPHIINLPEQEVFANDIVALGELILVSVTNTGNIYGISKDDPDMPKLMGNIPGANGMTLRDNMLIVASYNPTGVPTQENVIYLIDIASNNTELKKLIPNLKPGQYDGVALSDDGATLYFTSWGDGKESKPALYAYAMDGKSGARIIDLGVELSGPADICIKNGYLYLPDLPSSKVYVVEL